MISENKFNQDSLYFENQYKKIQRDFSVNKFDFSKLNEANNREYLNVLNEYLKRNGYGYTSKKLSGLINQYNLNKIDISRLLVDSKLILQPKLHIESLVKNGGIIEYLETEGLEKSFKLVYSTKDIPFNIYNIEWNNEEYVTCTIESSNSIFIKLKIDSQLVKSFTTVIIIYTSYGVEKFEFTIKCNEVDHNILQVENIEEFFELCKRNYDEGYKVFIDDNFIKWIQIKKYNTQLINYHQAKNLSFCNKKEQFNYFLKLSNVYIEDTIEKNDIKTENPINIIEEVEVKELKREKINVNNEKEELKEIKIKEDKKVIDENPIEEKDIGLKNVINKIFNKLLKGR